MQQRVLDAAVPGGTEPRLPLARRRHAEPVHGVMPQKLALQGLRLAAQPTKVLAHEGQFGCNCIIPIFLKCDDQPSAVRVG